MEPNTSQGSVATYARCVGMLKTSLLQISCRIFQWKVFEKWLRFDRIVAVSLVRSFLAHLYKSLCFGVASFDDSEKT